MVGCKLLSPICFREVFSNLLRIAFNDTVSLALATSLRGQALD
ncbi:hypothetical protein BH18THE2_BH18THE2_10520 [soil metagenome]